MKILAHRGYWKFAEEKNHLDALARAFERGWGVETDIRDYRGDLVISHDPANGKSQKFEALLAMHGKLAEKPLLALNIKADGLLPLLMDALQRFGIQPKNYFLFDASLPEQFIYIKRGCRIFTRSSEFEPLPAFMERSEGVWLDQFTDCDHIMTAIEPLLATGKIVSVVSPELHGRGHEALWEYLLSKKGSDNLCLCTDKPDIAEEYFK